MTNERPTEDARCHLFNTADRRVDVYVNYHDEPFATVEPGEDQPTFSVNSDADGTYGTYTFEARPVGDADGPPLASAAVLLEEGDSYAAVFHEVGEAEYALSIYEDDFSPSASSRLEIRHTGRPERIDWTLEPVAEADPRTPDDERAGSLERGEWQQAIDVTENEYRLEFEVDGEVVAFRQDLGLEANRAIVVYLLDDPRPWMGADEKEDHVLRQEFQVRAGEPREDVVTEPEEPHSTSDDNEPIQFDADSLELYHTNRTTAEIEATDPDGIVDGLAIEDVTPDADGFVVPDEGIDRTYSIGGTTTATLLARPSIEPGSYEVRIVSNPDSLGERVTCAVPVEVKPVTIDRLRDLVEDYREADEMTAAVASEVRSLLNVAEGYLDPAETSRVESLKRDVLALIEEFPGGRLARSLEAELDALFEAAGVVPADHPRDACSALGRVITVVGEHEDGGIGAEAAVDVETETRALRGYLGCG